MYEETYFIIYPYGDRTKLSVTSLNQYMMYEKDEYAVASRGEWSDEQEAISYAKELAEKHGLEFVGEKNDYLD